MSDVTTPRMVPQFEVLYFDGCPNHEALLARLHALLVRHDMVADVVTIRVGTDEDAQRLAFLGSPTLRIGGRDVEPGAESRTGYGMQCRL